MRIALKNCGYINPDNIEEYIARDGYQALAKALLEMTPEETLVTVKNSGLRGREGPVSRQERNGNSPGWLPG